MRGKDRASFCSSCELTAPRLSPNRARRLLGYALGLGNSCPAASLLNRWRASRFLQKSEWRRNGGSSRTYFP
ncbi:hypothetical protein BQ8794_130261 [Mesorhizobium prunaredense]|uniref:Uncharacterized protein n=1 Tax=Mesorhizobium prunaredense TaxID=1631249 RepID=A0A1R3V3I3_9HYPH|nr:hypothetical protein BQ8794_130261 [Mesorhizobium prunaredense]